MCLQANNAFNHKWKYVSGMWDVCPSYVIPDEEKYVSDKAPVVHFHGDKNISNCTTHIFSEDWTKQCKKCKDYLKYDGSHIGKATMCRILSEMKNPISTFHEDYYIPMLHKYKYYLSLVEIV